ncbi:protein kilB [Streptantibioticus parmotrematis]|uniref:protein kilB n=1 Tax=Streptantibioticus parmotrematis TaxID=2873249 RepID=UPI00340877E5
MATTIIAVLGTLLGGITTHLLQERGARTARNDARDRDRLVAITELVTALADHRRAMWTSRTASLSGADTEKRDAALAAAHATRSAITAPLTTLALLTPGLAGPGREAATATYAMREAADLPALEMARAEAHRTADALVDAASQYFN